MIIDGNALAKKILTLLKTRIKQQGIKPCLAIVAVGYHEPSYYYFRKIEKEAASIGIRVEKHLLLYDAPQDAIIHSIQSLNTTPRITGILLQFPLPPHINETEVMQALAPSKDVDGFHPQYRKDLMEGRPKILPPVYGAILELIKATKKKWQGKTAVALVHSETFGTPLVALLQHHHIHTTVHVVELPAQVRTRRILSTIKGADILITALGFPEIIQEHDLTPGVVVLDIGLSAPLM